MHKSENITSACNLHEMLSTSLNIDGGGASMASKGTVRSSHPVYSMAGPSVSGFVDTKPYLPLLESSPPQHIDDVVNSTSSPSRLVRNCSPLLNHHIQQSPIAAYQENVGGTTYFYPTSGSSSAIPSTSTIDLIGGDSNEYSLYGGVPNHVEHVVSKPNDTFFVSKDLQEDLLSRRLITLMRDSNQFAELPQVENYHQLCELERSYPAESLHKQSHLSYQSSMYKAVHQKSGTTYCLRRIHGFRLQNTKCIMNLDTWKGMIHPNVVQLHEMFTTKAFGDNSLIFVYDYHAGAETLQSKYFTGDSHLVDPFAADASPRPYSHQKNSILRHHQRHKLPEAILWNYIIQITSALRLMHSADVACRSLDASKIIVTSKNRLRLSCTGCLDVVSNDNISLADNWNLVRLYKVCQQMDLQALGRLVLMLACRSQLAAQKEHLTTAIEVIAGTYSEDLRNLIIYLLSSNQTRKSIGDLMPMIGARFYTQLEQLHNHIDVLEYEVGKELENGRLCRLVTKLATINERPECNMDATWSETGDRYMLKLFRDYVFHQVTEDGRPWVDMAHIVQCLNRLDAGTSEKVCLMSRDEQCMLVVSYAELKQCLEKSFSEILNGAKKRPHLNDDDEPLNCNSVGDGGAIIHNECGDGVMTSVNNIDEKMAAGPYTSVKRAILLGRPKRQL